MRYTESLDITPVWNSKNVDMLWYNPQVECVEYPEKAVSPRKRAIVTNLPQEEHLFYNHDIQNSSGTEIPFTRRKLER